MTLVLQYVPKLPIFSFYYPFFPYKSPQAFSIGQNRGQNQTWTTVDGGRGGWSCLLMCTYRHLVSSMKVDPGLSLSGVPGDVQDAPGQVHRLRRPDRPPRTQRWPRNLRKSHFFTRVTVVVTKPITILVTKPLFCLSIITNCCWPYSLLQSF